MGQFPKHIESFPELVAVCARTTQNRKKFDSKTGKCPIQHTKPILMDFLFHTGNDRRIGRREVLKSYHFVAAEMTEALMGYQTAMSYV